MTDRNDPVARLDELLHSIRRDRLDDETVAESTARAWDAIASELERPLAGCADFRAEIPALVAGTLPERRALLVEDHTRACVPCRRALLAARNRVTEAAPELVVTERRVVPGWLRLAVAAVVVVGIGLLGFGLLGNAVADHKVAATVVSSEPGLQLVHTQTARDLSQGERVGSRELIRTAKDHGGELQLADGSVVELAPRSEVSFRGAMRGTTIRLHRGHLIVRAADQHDGRLYVATDDCLVAVKGTVFAVDHGFKGSRVSVIEGEVEVRHAGERALLNPGEQITTNERLSKVAIGDQIAWSPNSQEHLALLRELTSLQREVVNAVEPRTPRRSSRLLDLVPADTAVYVAVPNLTQGVDEARAIVEDRIAQSPVLRSWWQENIVANGIDRQVDDVLDRLQDFGATVGDEVVIAVPASAVRGSGTPVVLAVLDDAAGFESIVADEAISTEAVTDGVVFVLAEDATSKSHGGAELLVRIEGDLAVAAGQRDDLEAAVDRILGRAERTFTDTELHARLSEAYARGVSWAIGIDVASIMTQAASTGPDANTTMLDRLGLLDASTMVFGYSRDGDHRDLQAGLYFQGSRRGAAAWLAPPAPMGSLDFVSPQATLAVAAVTRDAVEMFDDLLAAVSAADPEARAEIDEMQQALGIDLRRDLMAPLGGEGTFAVDGPVLPAPTWKLVVEVYQPDVLYHALETAVARINDKLTAAGRPELSLSEIDIGGRSYHVIRHPDSDAELFFLTEDGFLLIAPQAAIIERALQLRDSGLTLPRSSTFQELLPNDGYTACSALVWRNLGDLLESLPNELMSQLPGEAGVLLEHGTEPGLWCAYAGEDRILATGSGGSLLSSLPVLGLSELIRDHAATERAADGLSSAG